MRMNAGYFYGRDVEDEGTDHPFFVSSCGHYQLVSRREFVTVRKEGRRDWQLLYVAGGKVHFFLPEGEKTAREGESFLYPPGKPQHYGYFLKEKPDVYWIHFSGTQAEQMLEKTMLPVYEIFRPGFHGDFIMLFDKVISELQQCSLHSEELAADFLKALLYLLSRGLNGKNESQTAAGPEISRVVEWIHSHLKETRPMSFYAKQCSMSLSTFIRRFEAHTGLPPGKYIIRLRMINARELMASTRLMVSEIAGMVGYDNPLYFSRLFKKETGLSPREYRQLLSAKE